MSRKNAIIHVLSSQNSQSNTSQSSSHISNEDECFSPSFLPQSPNASMKSSFSKPVNYKYKIKSHPLHSLPLSPYDIQNCGQFRSFSMNPDDFTHIDQESFTLQSCNIDKLSSNASFSSISSEILETSSDFVLDSYNLDSTQYKTNSYSKHSSSNSFRNRLSFWEEKIHPKILNPLASDESTSPFAKLSDTTLTLKMKRSSYLATPLLDNFAIQDSNFNSSNRIKTNSILTQYQDQDINIANIKLSHSKDNNKLDNSHGGLYVANSMKEAKMHIPLDSLLERIISLFDSSVYEVLNSDFVNPYSFFLTYKWTGLAPEVLACKLRLHFSYKLEYTEEEGKLKPLAQLKPADQVKKLNIAQAFKFWIRVFPEDFQPNSLILDVMHSLKEAMRRENQTQLLNMLELQYFDTYTLNKKLSLIQKTTVDDEYFNANDSINPQSFEILKISSSELAKIIIWMEFSLFKKIPFAEFQKYAKFQNSSETQNINLSIKESNSIAMWIKSSILNERAPDARAVIIEKFIDVATEIRKLHAFQSLMSFVGALNSGCICPVRLALTWSLVPMEKIRMLHEFTSLLTMHNNYAVYRAELEHIKTQVRNFYFPILGVIFKDLIQLDAKSNLIDTGDLIEVNEIKLIQISKTIDTWRKSQNASLPKFPNFKQVDLVNAAIHLCCIIDEDELYKLSFHLEPNDPEKSEIDLKESEFFSAFIKDFDNHEIEPAVVKFHVQAMTKAIFSSYDKDHNGFLTEGEFKIIQKNFPFIQNFNQLDKNRDGLIGQEEVYVFLLTSLGNIKDYFTHSFKEFHEIHPALCSHCKSMMWCPIEAACKCRDCDIICHKHCKDSLVAECKPKGFHIKKSKITKQNTPKSRSIQTAPTDRSRHHSATELIDDSFVIDNIACNTSENQNYASKSPSIFDNINVGDNSKMILDTTNEMFLNYAECEKIKCEVLKLSEDNKKLRSQLNTALFALYRVKSDNLNLKTELGVVKSQLNGTNDNLQTNNVELQRQFVNVRNATGEFLLQQFAMLNNSSKSETYL